MGNASDMGSTVQDGLSPQSDSTVLAYSSAPGTCGKALLGLHIEIILVRIIAKKYDNAKVLNNWRKRFS